MEVNLYLYVVSRDFGFAPNPFHGFCTLATCVPRVRSSAKVGDWIMGVGGSRLDATGKCIYLMKVSEKMTFNEYWNDPRFQRKKPTRNGSLLMMVGDNIYYKQDNPIDEWIQSDSHHSNPDGTANYTNLERDTSSDNVLISDHFYYFGQSSPDIDLDSINYRNHRGHSKKSLKDDNVREFIETIENHNINQLNLVIADPYDFSIAAKRVDQGSGKIV